jgi:hypothetical protein
MSANSPRCVNLGPATQDRRLRIGVLAFSATLILAVVLARFGVAAHFRWLLALPFFVAVMHLAEAMYKTCPMLAARGVRDTDRGVEPVADPQELASMRGRGRRLVIGSALIAVTAAGLFAQLPWN